MNNHNGQSEGPTLPNGKVSTSGSPPCYPSSMVVDGKAASERKTLNRQSDSGSACNDLLSALRNPAWCYDEGGQYFEYVDADLARKAAKEIERLLKTVPVHPPDAKIGDKPIMATLTGLTHHGKHILIEGDTLDVRRFVREVEENYPLIASRFGG